MAKTSKGFNNLQHVQNQWGGSSAQWHEGGMWVLGCRSGQNVVRSTSNPLMAEERSPAR